MPGIFRPTSAADPNEAPSRGRQMFGLQGRLVLSFVAMISMAMAGSCWLSATQSSQQALGLVSEQARLVAYTLSMAAEPLLASGQRKPLDEIGADLLKTRNVLYVVFLDANRQPISLAKRYANFQWSDVDTVAPQTSELYVAPPRTSASFGQYVNVYAPVLDQNPKTPRRGKPDAAGSLAANSAGTVEPPIMGYVVVGVSLDHEMAQVQDVTWMIAGVGAVLVLISFPVAFMVVTGIFQPIRQLVGATRRISAGNYDVKIVARRNDLIGELSGAFAEMVTKIHRQREDLAFSNRKLGEANEQLNFANAQLSRANSELEQKVLERTVQLEAANRQLSGEIAEKDDFLRAVSHDLNAPLRNIAGMAAMLLAKHREKFDADIIHRLERIQKNVQVETDLISELLELSRIKTRRQTLERVDTESIVTDLAGVFEEDLRSRQIELKLDNALPALNAEKARIRQVFQNLIDNAIKYMGERSTREIHVGAICTGADETQFYVRDTGMGIEKDDVGKVFSIFRRGKSASVANIPGKGVGLASVKSIIETYNGTIWVESVLNEGTTFRFTINGKYVVREESPAEPMRQAA